MTQASLATTYPESVDMPEGMLNRQCLFLLLILLFSYSAGQASEELDNKIEQLDEAYQQLAGDIYQAGDMPATRIDDLDDLFALYNRLLSQKQLVEARQLIVNNLDTLAATRNSSHPAIVSISDNLLKSNERQLAEKIYSLTEGSGNLANMAYLNFIFAKYYARHRQWHRVKALVDDTFIDLSGDDVDYAYLLQGNALQYLKEHQKSVDSYNNIPASSPYYIHAQLNIALASLRQGWLSEARSILDKILPASHSATRTELINRVYLVLGYALLQKEYFRDARKAFRSISLNSEYSDRALMGISLAAISQGDYVGGLNAVNALKQKAGTDLSSDEAYLLVPHIYEKLDQTLIIEDSLSESIDRFQTRLLQLGVLKEQARDFDKIQFVQPTGALVLDGISFDFGHHFPQYLLANRHNLSQLAHEVSNPELLDRIKTLIEQYDRLLNEAIATLLDQYIKDINSYLNQARYALARHYDNQLVEAQ